MKVIARAPCRISLFGGGTDLASYKKGIVINLAINLRSKVQLNTEDDIFSLQNQVPYNATRELYHAILKDFGLGSFHFCSFVSTSDAYVRAGLGTSGSAGVALIKAICKTKKLEMTRGEIAERAFKIENKLWNTGRQDVYAAAFGGMNVFLFSEEATQRPIQREVAEKIKKHLFLYYMEGERKPQAKHLTNLKSIREIALEAWDNLDNPKKLGLLLDKAWQEKKKSNPNVSNSGIDKIYKEVMNKGVWGFKICGSGGAGYCVVMSEKKPKLSLEEVDFDIDWQGLEARII
jgi:D-glycero-alpha-D-manno-heptose-7-phosphate kinase